MVKKSESVGHSELVGGEETTKHSHPGGGGGGKESDAGIHTTLVSKAWEAVSFHSTFSSIPVVCVSTQSSSSAGKKIGVKDVTVSGFSIYGEVVAGNIAWIAREQGFG